MTGAGVETGGDHLVRWASRYWIATACEIESPGNSEMPAQLAC